MKNLRLMFSVAVTVLLVAVMGVFPCFAETVPVPTTGQGQEPTQNVDVVETVPPATDVHATDTTEIPTTAPVETEPVTEPTTVIYTDPAPTTERPTEYVYEPNTHSNYVNPNPPYTPADQDFKKNDFEELDEAEIMALVGGSANGLKDFSNIKNNNSRGDQKSYLLLILGVVLLFLGVAGFTFVFVYKPQGKHIAKTARAAVSGRSDRRKSPAPRHDASRRKDDYNDGF